MRHEHELVFADDVAELLDEYTPRPDPQPAWREIQHRSGARSRRALLVALGLVALTAPALALSSSLRDIIGLARPEPVLEQATLLLSAPVGNGFWAHMWTSPSSTGGQCEFITRDRTATTSVTEEMGAGVCGGGPVIRTGPEHPLNVGLSVGRLRDDPTKWVPPVVSGAVLPSLQVTQVKVIWNGGSLSLRLRNNRFLGGSPLLYMPPFDRFPFTVVAYDAAGRKVAEKRLQSPSLLLMNGWKEYTPAYKKWKAQRGR
jgi:hypothetical protein